jgi:choline-sulfatase
LGPEALAPIALERATDGQAGLVKKVQCGAQGGDSSSKKNMVDEACAVGEIATGRSRVSAVESAAMGFRVASLRLLASAFVFAAACSRPDPGAGAQAATAPPVVSSSRPEPARPSGPARDMNVLLISVDSLRADMPWAGYERQIAPRMTALEKRATSYTNAYAISSYTSMSVGGLLGGRYPSEMKRDGYFFSTFPKENVMFPSKLQEAGIRTLAAHGHLYFKKGASGFERGFDVYEMVSGLKWNSTTDENVTGDKIEAIAERLLSDEANTGGRFFAWFHFMDPHDQYMRHPGIEPYGKKARDLYDGEVTFADEQVGRLLDFVAKKPWASRTAIIVTGDHGEAFGEHGMWRHGFEVFQPLVRVPWMFVLPGMAGRRIGVARSHIDMAPTILGLFGMNAGDLPGKSLVAEIYGNEPAEPRDVIVDLPRTSDNDRRRALVHDHYKLIAFGDDSYYQVFDLEADPDESRSIAKTDTAKYDEMVVLYKKKRSEIKDVPPYACRTLKGAPAGRGY